MIDELYELVSLKPNRDDILIEAQQFMAGKANLNDVKKTMAEVAANIEERPTFIELKRLLESKIDKSELNYSLGQKVSFEDMRSYCD